MSNSKNFFNGFTVVEIIVVVGVITILAAAVFVAVDPARRFAEARNARRWTDVRAILDAVKEHQVRDEGVLITGVDTSLRVLGTVPSACDLVCGADESTIEIRVAGQNSDAEEKAPYDGYMYLDSTDLELVQEGSTMQQVGMRFQGVNIPQDATITNAFITFTVDETDTKATNLTFYGQDIDDAQEFTEADFNITGRTKTSNSVVWSSVPSWTQVRAAHQTPDLASVIQEIVSRPGWRSGNAMAIIVSGTGERTAESYDGVSSAAPLLTITFQGETAESSCLDIASGLTPYLHKIPFDPKEGDSDTTHYAIKTLGTGSLKVATCSPELGEVIEIIR